MRAAGFDCARESNVADLLECLLQISALRHTTSCLAGVSGQAGPAGPGAEIDLAPGVGTGLVEAEQELSDRLRAVLPNGPSLPSTIGSPPGTNRDPGLQDDRTYLGRFLLLRHANLAILDRCSADDLSRKVASAGSGARTVADLVASALARDTDTLGTLRSRLGKAPIARM